MAEEQQDVYITGIAGSIDTWSKEVTQKSIESSLKQLNADSNSILRLLKATASGVDLSADQLKKVGDSLKKQVEKVEENGDDANRNHESEIRHNKGTFKALYDLHKGGNKKAAQFAADQSTRDKNAAALHKMGYSEATSQRAANVVSFGKRIERLGKKLVAGGVIVGAAIAEETSAQDQGVKERFNMVRDMRLMGLFAGQKLANQGFIEIAKTISDTNFTFGEATEFTKRFAKAVGVTGVKGALDFANTMADATLDDPNGLMVKYSMAFGDVANMSGQYLETLRLSGQLQGRITREQEAGMMDFMTGVEATSNVLKISMEEAAELMKNTLTDDRVGLIALLDKDKQQKITSLTTTYDSLKGGKLVDTLTGMLAAGSQQEFMMTEQGQGMLGNALDLDMLKYVATLLPTFQDGTREEADALFVNGIDGFIDGQLQIAEELKMQVLQDQGMRQGIGELIKFQTRVGALTEGIQSVGDEAIIATMAEEKDRKGMQLFESGQNAKMQSYMQNLYDTTISQMKNQLASHDLTVAAADNVSAIAANVGSLWSQLWLGLGTDIKEVTTNTLNIIDNLRAFAAGEQTNWFSDDDHSETMKQYIDLAELGVPALKSDENAKNDLAKVLEDFQKQQISLNEKLIKKWPTQDEQVKASNTDEMVQLKLQQAIVAKAIVEINALLQSLN